MWCASSTRVSTEELRSTTVDEFMLGSDSDSVVYVSDDSCVPVDVGGGASSTMYDTESVSCAVDCAVAPWDGMAAEEMGAESPLVLESSRYFPLCVSRYVSLGYDPVMPGMAGDDVEAI